MNELHAALSLRLWAGCRRIGLGALAVLRLGGGLHGDPVPQAGGPSGDDLVPQGQAAGYGVITGVHSLDVKEYQKVNKPIVALDRYLGEHIPVVAVNHKEGGRLAAEELIRSGCRKILHFRGSAIVDSPYHERHIEFERIMKEHHIPTYTYDMEWNRLDLAYYKEVVQDVFSKTEDFDGVFAVDALAIECMNETIRRHRKVPRDVKFIAYDGTFITELSEPRMTAVVQPLEGLARESVRLLTDLINGKEYHDEAVLLGVELRRGKTTLP